MPRRLSVKTKFFFCDETVKTKLMVISLSLVVCSVGIQAQALAVVFAQIFEGQSSPTPGGGWRIPGAPADLKAC